MGYEAREMLVTQWKTYPYYRLISYSRISTPAGLQSKIVQLSIAEHGRVRLGEFLSSSDAEKCNGEQPPFFGSLAAQVWAAVMDSSAGYY